MLPERLIFSENVACSVKGELTLNLLMSRFSHQWGAIDPLKAIREIRRNWGTNNYHFYWFMLLVSSTIQMASKPAIFSSRSTFSRSPPNHATADHFSTEDSDMRFSCSANISSPRHTLSAMPCHLHCRRHCTKCRLGLYTTVWNLELPRIIFA